MQSAPEKRNVTGQLLDKIMELDARVITLHTLEVEYAVADFQAVCRKSGRAIYHWSDNGGLQSMKSSEFSVPGTRGMADALRYVLQSMHYGIYLFSDFGHQLRGVSVELMRQIAVARGGNDRKVILIGQDIAIPARLADITAHIRHQPAEVLQPRLRDGRWVV